jgi:hypothetical protein
VANQVAVGSVTFIDPRSRLARAALVDEYVSFKAASDFRLESYRIQDFGVFQSVESRMLE